MKKLWKKVTPIPSYKVQTSTNIAMGSDSISTKADRKTENSSEFPNNCKKDCFLCKWLGDVDVCGRCRNRNLFAEADTEPTISKMEQVDEPQIIKVGMATDSVTGKVLGVTLDTDCPWK